MDYKENTCFVITFLLHKMTMKPQMSGHFFWFIFKGYIIYAQKLTP